ncbi:enoyl-CoA hydratase/isomerase [Bordetella pertussis]|nr:enoyl-CoA hydratase/isomerase [Bordetella pertussis]
MNKSDSFELIEYQAADGIARIAHNRPQARNAESQGCSRNWTRRSAWPCATPRSRPS